MKKASFATEGGALIMSFRTKTQAASALSRLSLVPYVAAPVRFDFGGVAGVRWVLRANIIPGGGTMLSVDGVWINYTTSPWLVVFTTVRGIEVITTHYSRSEAVAYFRSVQGRDEESFVAAIRRYNHGVVYDPAQNFVEGCNLQAYRQELCGVV